MRKNENAALRIKEQLFNIYNNAAEDGAITPSRDRVRYELRACESTVRTAELMLIEEERIIVDRPGKNKFHNGGTVLIVDTGKRTISNMGLGIRKSRETEREKTVPVPARKCSQCHKKFRPQSRYLFRCDTCKKSKESIREDHHSWLYV